MKTINKVKAFLLDMDGTFYLGDRLLPGALELLKVLNRKRIPFYFLTNNSSKSKLEYCQKLIGMGVNEGDARVITSGDATMLYLKQHTQYRKVYLVGTPGLADAFYRNGFELDEDDPEVLVLGFDTTLTYRKLEVLCKHVRAGVPFIATHPDINCPTPHGFIPDTGSILALVKVSTGREPNLVVGKPNPMIATMAAESMGVQTNECCMVGDRLYTDIAMGETAGVKTVLMLSGETKMEDLTHSRYQPDLVMDSLLDLIGWIESEIGEKN